MYGSMADKRPSWSVDLHELDSQAALVSFAGNDFICKVLWECHEAVKTLVGTNILAMGNRSGKRGLFGQHKGLKFH